CTPAWSDACGLWPLARQPDSTKGVRHENQNGLGIGARAPRAGLRLTPAARRLRGAPETHQSPGRCESRAMKADPALDGYFEEAASWDADRIQQGRRSLRLALGVAGAGWLAVLLLAGALILLMPLKRVEPFVVRVDNATGVVDVVPVYSGHAGIP